ncbi:MAG: lasso peptide biosynthesis B2 protein [Bdellovibrionales bacterium]|nr:lasso peptide biosynthesis B2 protein [Bdellovibrionales bacterium]
MRQLAIVMRYLPASLVILLMLPVVKLVVTYAPFGVLRRLAYLLDKIPGVCPRPRNPGLCYEDLLRVLNLVSRRFSCDFSCLVRALVLRTALKLYGLKSELFLGAQNSSGFFAHAWLEGDFIVKPDRQGCTPFSIAS